MQHWSIEQKSPFIRPASEIEDVDEYVIIGVTRARDVDAYSMRTFGDVP
jgi:hypothetical protein